MTEIQKVFLELLKEIDKICKENDIEYYLDGGSALGAIRHRGFLPWDDDSDIMFTRDNYLKFKEVVRNNPLPNRTLEDLDNCPEYTMVYARYCDTQSTSILRTQMMDQFHSGIFVDIFIMDPIEDTREARKEYIEMVHGYAEYINPFYYDNIIGCNNWYKFFKEMGEKEGRKAVDEFVEKRLFSTPDTEETAYALRYDNGAFTFPKKMIGKPVYVPFEDTFMPVVEQVEDYLRVHFGDSWNIIPPHDEAEVHNVVINEKVPYEQFRDSYLPYIDKQQAIKDYNDLHDLRLKRRFIIDEVDNYNYNLTAKLFAKMITIRDEKADITLKEYVESGQYEIARDILGNYYDMQLNRWVMRQKVFVPLKDDALYAALYLMLVDGRYSKADKILSVRKEQEPPLSDDLIEVDKIIKTIRRVTKAFEKGDLEEALSCSKEVMCSHPNVLELRERFLSARSQLAINNNDKEEAAHILNELSETVRADYVADRLKASELKLLYYFGDESQRSEAINSLKEFAEKTSDGMLRLEIIDMCNEAVNIEKRERSV